MLGRLAAWFGTRSVAARIVMLAAVLDPIGIAGGYLLAPEVGVEPLVGAAAGAVVAGVPLSLYVLSVATSTRRRQGPKAP